LNSPHLTGRIPSHTTRFCRELKQLIVAASLNPEAAVINASLVPDIFILHAAARAALIANQRATLKSRSLHAEVVFNIAGSKHIGESLGRFGVNDSCDHLLIARFNATPEEIETIKTKVQGDVVALEELPSLINVELIRKYYKVLDQELVVGSLVDAMMNRIGSRDMM
jgi:EKC/KEOPS complex subunit CGI121/TPRKB